MMGIKTPPKISRVQTRVHPATQEHLEAGLELKSGSISGIPQKGGGHTDRVLLEATNDYGSTQEWVTIKKVKPNPPQLELPANTELKAYGDTDFSFQPTGTNVLPTADFTVRDIIWSATGLPPGLTINPVTGQITGRPTSYGNATATITCTTATGSSSITLSFNSSAEAPYTMVGRSSSENVPVSGESRWGGESTRNYRGSILSAYPQANVRNQLWWDSTGWARWMISTVNSSDPSKYNAKVSVTGRLTLSTENLAEYRRANIWDRNRRGRGQNYMPLPGEAGEIFLTDVIFYSGGTISNSVWTTDYIYFRQGCGITFQTYISDRLQQEGIEFSAAWGSTLTISTSYPSSTTLTDSDSAAKYIYGAARGASNVRVPYSTIQFTLKAFKRQTNLKYPGHYYNYKRGGLDPDYTLVGSRVYSNDLYVKVNVPTAKSSLIVPVMLSHIIYLDKTNWLYRAPWSVSQNWDCRELMPSYDWGEPYHTTPDFTGGKDIPL